MEKAWFVLEELGAVDEEGKLTPLGRHMVCNPAVFHTKWINVCVQSMLPTDPRLAKVYSVN
jgi:Helicase associated domain (HA2)